MGRAFRSKTIQHLKDKYRDAMKDIELRLVKRAVLFVAV